jgi:hypothetical protein
LKKRKRRRGKKEKRRRMRKNFGLFVGYDYFPHRFGMRKRKKNFQN